MEFSSWLRDELAERKMTMSELASRVEVTHAAVSYWVSGHRRPDVRSALRIAQVLDVPASVVLEKAGHDRFIEDPFNLGMSRLSTLYQERETLADEMEDLSAKKRGLDSQIAQLEREVESSFLVNYDAIMAQIARAELPYRTADDSLFVYSREPQRSRWREPMSTPWGVWGRLYVVGQMLGRQICGAAVRAKWTDEERSAFLTGVRLGMEHSQSFPGYLDAESVSGDSVAE